MTLITLDKLGANIDDLRSSVLAADGSEYGMTRSRFQTRRIYDWSHRCYRTVRVAELGGKQPEAQPLATLPDATLPAPGETIVMVCKWLEEVGPQPKKVITERFDVHEQFCANWAHKRPDVLAKTPTGNRKPGQPFVLYHAAEGWREAYAQMQQRKHKQKLAAPSAAILAHIQQHPGQDRRQVAEACGLTTIQVRNRARTLLAHELIREEGFGSNTRYWPTDSTSK